MTLQADLAALDRASRLIGEIRRSIDTEQSKLRADVDDLLAASWNGVVASQFSGAWSQWRRGMAEILSGLRLEGAAVAFYARGGRQPADVAAGALMQPIKVTSTGYIDAVGQLAGANREVIDAVNKLTDTLYASGSMAGSDTGGTTWAGSYDPAAAQLVEAGCSIGEALANMANLLNGSLANHAGADYGARMYPGEPDSVVGDTNPDHGTETLVTPAPPSAAGGTGDQPSWWHWIASHVKSAWPDADTDQLRAAGDAWATAGTTISNQQYGVNAADIALYDISSPEMDDVHAACDEITTHLQDLGAMYKAVGTDYADYAGYVDAKHQEIKDQLSSFIKWTIGIEAGGAILTEIGGEVWGQAVEAAKVDSAAAKVMKILGELAELAAKVKVAIDTAIEALTDLVGSLAKFVNAKLVTALEKTGVTLAKDLPVVGTVLTREDLSASQLANLKRYTKKLPAAADETVISREADGAVRFSTKVPGRVPGSYAMYDKVVDASGETVAYTKTTVAPDGTIIHVKDKLNP